MQQNEDILLEICDAGSFLIKADKVQVQLMTLVPEKSTVTQYIYGIYAGVMEVVSAIQLMQMIKRLQYIELTVHPHLQQWLVNPIQMTSAHVDDLARSTATRYTIIVLWL